MTFLTELFNTTNLNLNTGALLPYYDFWNDIIHQVLSTYISLIPELFSCVSIVLACQICFLQFGMISMGTSPTSCLAVCAGSTVASCGQMLANTVSVIARRLMEQHPDPDIS